MEDINHSERKHALLSASASNQWLNCTPSKRLEEKQNIKDEGSDFAKEGTLAHEFGDLNLQLLSGEISKREYNKKIKVLRADEYYTDEMEEEVSKYTDYVMEQFNDAKRKSKHAFLSIEEKIDLTHYVPDGFGTNDAVIGSDEVLEVDDLKYGKGVVVKAENNSQLMLYGLGALRKLEFLYDFKTVRLVIIQPRLNSISTWEISADDLRKWGEEVVKPKAKMAFKGEGEQVAGDHCRWCKVKHKCKALATLANSLAREEFKDVQDVKDEIETVQCANESDAYFYSDEELIHLYEKIPIFTMWANSLSSHLLKTALEGKKWPGYKLVEGRSNRKFTDEKEVAKILEKEGFDSTKFTTTKMNGITAIEKLVSKKAFPSLLGDHVTKPPGKPTLVPVSDTRKAINKAEQAAEDFKNIKINS